MRSPITSLCDIQMHCSQVGYKRGHALYLTEVEGVLQLKPDLDHHDPAPSEKLEEKPKEELTQLQARLRARTILRIPRTLFSFQAKMRRRETPAEQQRRENSYAHMAKKERLEKWKPLKAIGSTSRITDKVLEQLTTPVDTYAIVTGIHPLDRSVPLQRCRGAPR